MLSSLLLRSSLDKKEKVNKDPIIAKKIDLSIRTIAQVGCGKASCSYSIDKDEQCLVFYVSSLLAHRDSTRQHLSVTKCQVLSKESTGKQNCQTLTVSKLTTIDGTKSLPTLALTKELHASTLALHAGAISAEDLLLHLGSVKAGTMLEIRLDFVLKFTLPSSPDSLQYVFTNKLPAHHLCYNVSLATTLPIEDVTPLHTISNPNDFRWNYIAGSSCVVEIQYECKPHSDKATGLTVQLVAAPSPSGCCSISYPQDATKTRGGCNFNLRCDGLMMMNSCLTPDAFPASVKDKQLHPSEFIFVVDCSGSMSGSNIQSASDTLITCIKSLPAGSYFNVIAFGSNFRHLFHTSSEYTKWSVEKAIKFANEIQATLGGTELLDPLRWIFKQGKCGSLARQIFIVTDGGVNSTAHVLHTVRKNRHQAR